MEDRLREAEEIMDAAHYYIYGCLPVGPDIARAWARFVELRNAYKEKYHAGKSLSEAQK